MIKIVQKEPKRVKLELEGTLQEESLKDPLLSVPIDYRLKRPKCLSAWRTCLTTHENISVKDKNYKLHWETYIVPKINDRWISSNPHGTCGLSCVKVFLRPIWHACSFVFPYKGLKIRYKSFGYYFEPILRHG